MTTTHDLPTVAGWWQGRDIDWRAKARSNHGPRRRPTPNAPTDRALLWQAMRDSGAAQGEAPDAGVVPKSRRGRRYRACLASACDLMILPIEDVLGLAEQPNLPNTIDEHPNWRRRLPGPAAQLLDAGRRRRQGWLRQ